MGFLILPPTRIAGKDHGTSGEALDSLTPRSRRARHGGSLLVASSLISFHSPLVRKRDLAVGSLSDSSHSGGSNVPVQQQINVYLACSGVSKFSRCTERSLRDSTPSKSFPSVAMTRSDHGQSGTTTRTAPIAGTSSTRDARRPSPRRPYAGESAPWTDPFNSWLSVFLR